MKLINNFLYNLDKELSDIRASILDIVNNFVNSPVVKENKGKIHLIKNK